MWLFVWLHWRLKLPQMPRLHNVSRFIFWLALIIPLIALPLRAQTSSESGQSLSLAEYRAELAAAVAQLEAVPAEDADSVIEELQDRFAAITEVEFPSGEQVATQSLLDDIFSSTDDNVSTVAPAPLVTSQEIALARLRGAMAQIDASVNDNTTTRLAILAEILARPEFNTPLSLWDRFWQWLENLLSQIFPDSEAAGDATWLSLLLRLVSWIVTILIVAAVIWLLSYWLQRLLRSFVNDARVYALMGDDDLPRSAAEARQQARVAAQSGLYRDAVRRLYLAALLQLSEHQLIDFERSLTNREVLTRVPTDSPIRPHLEPVVTTFDEVWYGVHEPDQATFTAYEQEIDRLAAVAERTAVDSARRGEA
jgi:hypothetical protein